MVHPDAHFYLVFFSPLPFFRLFPRLPSESAPLNAPLFLPFILPLKNGTLRDQPLPYSASSDILPICSLRPITYSTHPALENTSFEGPILCTLFSSLLWVRSGSWSLSALSLHPYHLSHIQNCKYYEHL
jgi:hypothetical protein